MSEGTMHRPAQRDMGIPPTPFRQWGRDQHDQGERQPGRRGPRLRRLLVCAAAVPAVLVAAGCSSDSGSDSGSGSGGDAKQKATSSSQPTQSASANTVQPAAYATLPEPCSVLSAKTLGDLVPKAAKSGKKGKSSEAGTRSSCSWNSLQNNGVKGSQFRWLNVSLLRFDSDATRGEGNKLAHEYYTKQVQDAKSVQGASNTASEPVSGTGDEATTVRYVLDKKEGTFRQQTVVARVENVVVTLDYNGAGLAGDKTPDVGDLTAAAEKAAKETVSAVSAANKGGGKASDAPAQKASKNASPSKGASSSASESGKN
ncbi:DUF3558 family protein [Streptomyces colonosanans]|uniref:DUF3558 domain-containing protein n=1 Tax=Streptomyces colonosanans TaxID=1428652 RepID=A0A1S2Q3I4_9ACTN|nr:DUF3558 family protein [Streptomyces colonosanans]OIK00126.1 DUF3558 domain-containing protein [Streptomyces colonosanans]